MKNTLGDLNNHLFAELERLDDEELTGEALEQEMQRAKSIATIATQIINNGRLVLDAHKAIDERLIDPKNKPKMLEGN